MAWRSTRRFSTARKCPEILISTQVLTQPAFLAQFVQSGAALVRLGGVGVAQSGTALVRLGGVGAGMVRFGVKISGTKGAESVAGVVALVCPFLMPSRSIEEILLYLLLDVLDRALDGLECSSSSSDAAARVPDDVPDASAFNSCQDACCGTRPRPKFTVFVDPRRWRSTRRQDRPIRARTAA